MHERQPPDELGRVMFLADALTDLISLGFVFSNDQLNCLQNQFDKDVNQEFDVKITHDVYINYTIEKIDL